MKFIFIVRRTKLWYSGILHKLWGLHTRELQRLWDTILIPDFITVRQALAKIAEENYLRLGYDDILYYMDDNELQPLLQQSNICITPHDDDDWLPDEFCENLRGLTISSETKLIRWNRLKINIVKHFCSNPKPLPQIPLTIDSNCYAVITPVKFYHLFRHGTAKELQPFVDFIPPVSPVKFETPICSSILKRHKDKDRLIDSIERAKQFQQFPQKLSPQYEKKWDMWIELLTRIKVK